MKFNLRRRTYTTQEHNGICYYKNEIQKKQMISFITNLQIDYKKSIGSNTKKNCIRILVRNVKIACVIFLVHFFRNNFG